MSVNKECNIFLCSQSYQISILALISISKQGKAIQLINMPTTGYKAGWYIGTLHAKQKPLGVKKCETNI